MSNPFGQMLKLWRQRLGLSQLDLSLKSDMSAKHISFLETGRSTPSKDAVIKLANALSLSATDTQLLMKQAGFHIEQDSFSSSSDVELALKMILDKHEPYPGVISDYCLEPQYLNNAAIKLLEWIEVDLTHFSSIVDVIFSEQGFRSYITNWDEMATVTIRLTKMKSMAM